jgi:excisionase family DNA binding protein
VREMRQTRSDVFQIQPQAKEAFDKAALVAEGHTILLMQAPDGSVTQLPDALVSAFIALAAGLATGNAVLVAESDSTVSPTAAADMLGVSRPMITRWIAEGLLTDVPVGSHHRIPIASVVALRDARTRAGYRAMDAMKTAGDPDSGTRVAAARDRARKRIATRSAG